INGIISGITSMVSKLYSSIKSALSGLVGKAKSALGIASPSKVFAKQVGAFIPPGIGEGLKTAMPGLLSDTKTAMGDLVDAASEPVSIAAAVGTAVTGSRAYTASAIPGAGYGGGASYGNGTHFEQTNNYYVPVATPSETSRAQREAARKLLRGVK
ncbi:MAG: hypothetical protein LUG65_04360, partial [Clostridiales bacterium]|nr:hypothetical protein [Clostridiales bacterium]